VTRVEVPNALPIPPAGAAPAAVAIAATVGPPEPKQVVMKWDGTVNYPNYTLNVNDTIIARQNFCRTLFADRAALHCTATARILNLAQCSAIP